MIKALITIEVDIDTPRHFASGLSDSCNPTHPGIKVLENDKRDYIWDYFYDLLADKKGFTKIVKVSLLKEAK